MLIGTVAGIDYRSVGHRTGIFGRSSLEMAHDNQVHIVRHHLYGILQRFPFGGGGGIGVGKSYHTSAQAVDRRFKTQARTSRRLEKQRRYNLSVKNLVIGIFLKEPRVLKDSEDVLFREVINGYE